MIRGVLASSISVLRPEVQRIQRFAELAQAIGLSEDRPVPQTTHEANLVEHVLASELEQLSLDEQERRQLQLYGLDTPNLIIAPPDSLDGASSTTTANTTTEEESSSLASDSEKISSSVSSTSAHGHMDKKLQEFEEILAHKLLAQKNKNKDDSNNTLAYELAYYWNPEYCQDCHFRLQFIRAEHGSVPDAVDLFLYHFKIKRELFVPTNNGHEANKTTTDTTTNTNKNSGNTQQAILGRPIRLSDLDADDIATVRSGFFQIGKTTDIAGRTVIYLSPLHRKFKTIRNLQRAAWYIGMSMLHDKEREHDLGVVVVLSFHRFSAFSAPQFMSMRHIRLALPLLLAGIHVCYSGNANQRPIIAGLQLFQHCSPKRSIMLVHEGEPKETFSKLRAFGIPVDGENSPVLEGGEYWSTKWHLEWLQNKRAEEEAIQLQSGDYDFRPRRFDVLFGKGKESLQHPGTLRCNHLVDMFQKRYESAGRRAKTQIAEEILAIVHESNGRFLKREKKNGLWVEVDSTTAREKISHFFRQKRNATMATQGNSKVEHLFLESLQTSDESSLSTGPDSFRGDDVKELCSVASPAT